MQWFYGTKIAIRVIVGPLLCVSVVSIFPGCAVKRWVWRTAESHQEMTLSAPSGSGSAPVTPSTADPALSAPAPQGGFSDLFSSNQQNQKSLVQPATEAELRTMATELQRAVLRDTYRFPAPKDATGVNVYKAALLRLQNYEATSPHADPLLLAFIRGQAYERLHDYEQAIAQYHIASQSQNGLKPEVGKALEALHRFHEIKQNQATVTASTPVAYLQALDRQVAAWQALQQQYAGTPYEILAREEEEQVDQARVAFLELNRYRIEDGNESVILAYNQLMNKHKESKNLLRYQIQLGDFYCTLAQEYVAQHDPQSLHFDASTFEEVGRAALRLYAQVAHENGRLEKQEAQGKLEALQAYMAKISRLSR